MGLRIKEDSSNWMQIAKGNGVVMFEPLAMTTRFHDREPARKEEGDEKRHWTRLVSFRKSIGHG